MKRIFVIAGGPSHVLEDALAARESGTVVAVNCSIFSAPFADYLFAADNSWWRTYAPALDWFPDDRRLTTASTAATYGARRLRRQKGTGIGGPFVEGCNSGHQGISMAFSLLEAQQIILLGFDCQFTGGRIHHHGNHPDRLITGEQGCSNPRQTESWAKDHLTLAADARKKGVEILNCSRETSLDCYERANLWDVIHGS